MNDPVRCINIDWLECFCHQNIDLTPEYFRSQGYFVKVREYGTPQYRQMFTVYEWYNQPNGRPISRPFMEIRRLPYSLKSQGGIFLDNDCHIRMCNFWLYVREPIIEYVRFCQRHQIDIKSITRIDLALDFQTFDSGDDPSRFLARYFGHRYKKIGSELAHAHGEDILHYKVEAVDEKIAMIEQLMRECENLQGSEHTYFKTHFEDKLLNKEFNSVKWYHERMKVRDRDDKYLNYCDWGGVTSPVQVRLYDKTEELDREGHHKDYIEQAWRQVPFDRDADGELTKHVWRLELAIRSQIKGFVNMDDGELRPWNVSVLRNKDDQMRWFKMFAARYFRFIYVEKTTEDNIQRTNRSKQKKLFVWDEDPTYCPRTYKPVTYRKSLTNDRKIKQLLNTLAKLSSKKGYQITDESGKTICETSEQVRTSAVNIMAYLDQVYKMTHDVPDAHLANSELLNFRAMSKGWERVYMAVDHSTGEWVDITHTENLDIREEIDPEVAKLRQQAEDDPSRWDPHN